MKAFKISLLAALISSPLAAQTLDESWEIGVFGDYIKSSTHKDHNFDWQQLEAGKSIGVDLHKIINDVWNVRVELARTRFDTLNGHDKEYGSRYGVDAIYKFEDSNAYLFTGAKRFNTIKSYNALDVGAGYNYQINDQLSLYGEAAIYKDVNYGYVDQGLKLGIKYTFGDAKKAPAVTPAAATEPAKKVTQPVFVDSDKDGVSDDNDRCQNTPANYKVDATGCEIYAVHNDEINLAVNFAHNSANVDSDKLGDIQRLANFMKKYPTTSVEIEGHTSALGSNEYNKLLSAKRAEAVKTVLVEQFDIEAARITANGYGKSRLLSQENTRSAHEMNRRVVAKVTASTKKAVSKH